MRLHCLTEQQCDLRLSVQPLACKCQIVRLVVNVLFTLTEPPGEGSGLMNTDCTQTTGYNQQAPSVSLLTRGILQTASVQERRVLVLKGDSFSIAVFKVQKEYFREIATEYEHDVL